MTAPTIPPEVVTAGYAAQQQATRATVAGYLNALWARLTSWRTPDADQFAAQAAPIVTGGQQRTAALTAAYLQHMLAAGGGTPGSLDLSGMDDTTIRGVPAVEVYRRPFTQLWYDLSRGRPLDQAVTAAGARLQDLVATDLQLAKTHTSQRILSASTTIIGARRQLSNKPRHCALCLLTSSRVYHKADLQPMHPGCSCDPVPVFAGEHIPDVDPDAVHDAIRADLGDSYVNASGRGYKDLVVTHQHGELGPVLGFRGQHFTGPPT
jgi:hypothetical protein